LTSATDAKGQRKEPARLEAERKRAVLVEQVSRRFNPTELAIRIQLAADTTPSTPSTRLANIMAAYVADEVKKLEAEGTTKKP
jgi:hypothetical protein